MLLEKALFLFQEAVFMLLGIFCVQLNTLRERFTFKI